MEARKRINVADDPSLKDKVRDGSLFVWECPDCGTANLAVYDTLYHDPEEKVMIWLLPPGSVDESSVEALEQQLRDHSDDLDGYILRRVEDVGSLIEKVNIHDALLDDVIVEMCKWVTRRELAQKTPSALNAPLRFLRTEGADNDLVFALPLDGQMQVLNVGFNVYEDARGILLRNPAIHPDPGFAEVNAAWLDRYFR